MIKHSLVNQWNTWTWLFSCVPHVVCPRREYLRGLGCLRLSLVNMEWVLQCQMISWLEHARLGCLSTVSRKALDNLCTAVRQGCSNRHYRTRLPTEVMQTRFNQRLCEVSVLFRFSQLIVGLKEMSEDLLGGISVTYLKTRRSGLQQIR